MEQMDMNAMKVKDVVLRRESSVGRSFRDMVAGRIVEATPPRNHVNIKGGKSAATSGGHCYVVTHASLSWDDLKLMEVYPSGVGVEGSANENVVVATSSQ
ncbi:hypothetical protein V6N13_051101 [Hibiscus sabdariffa]